MKKQELIHLHGLLAEVCTHCSHVQGISMDLDEYDSHGVRPTSIHQSKTDHKIALFALAQGITSSLTEEPAEPIASRAD